MNRLTFFSQDFYSDECPHKAIIVFITNWINLYHNPDSTKVAETVNRHIGYIFDNDSPGFSLEADGNITGYYDFEWMPEERIKEFISGESYIVSFDDDSMLFPLAQYDREELSSWFSLALERYMELFPSLKKSISKIENNYYSPSEVKSNLMKKIKGEVDWTYGVCGKLSSEQVASWNKKCKEI